MCDPSRGRISHCSMLFYKHVTALPSFIAFFDAFDVTVVYRLVRCFSIYVWFPWQFFQYDVISPNPAGLYVYRKCHVAQNVRPRPGSNIALANIFYKYMMPLASKIQSSIHSNKYSSLNSISKAFKNAKYSSLKVFFLWCSFCFSMYWITSVNWEWL